MEEAGIITPMFNAWGGPGRKFSPKKKGSDQLRVVHNYIPLNDCTVKLQYLVPYSKIFSALSNFDYYYY